MSGDRGLLAAVLLAALDDLKAGNGHSSSAAVWIFSDREDGPFDFLSVCATLDIDAARVRRMLRPYSRNRPVVADEPRDESDDGDDDELREEAEA